MKNRILFILILILVPTAFAGINEDIYITPNDYDNSLSVKFVTTIYVDDEDYYYEPFTYQEYFESWYEDLKISDFGENKLKQLEIQNNDSGIIYEFKIPEISYEEPYQILYEFKIPYAISEYLGNYNINFYLNGENNENIVRDVYFCKPFNSERYIQYDSTPEDTLNYNTISYSIPIINISSFKINPIDPINYNYNVNPYLKDAFPNFCEDGQKELLYSETKIDFDDSIGFYEIKYHYGNKLLKKYSENNLEIQIPEIYSNKVSNLMKSKNVIPLLKEKYKFNIPNNISIKIVSDDDKVFDIYDERYGILCYENGICFLKNSGLNTESSEYDLFNFIKTIVIASSIQTYGEMEDNWFSEGYNNKIVLDLMDENNFDTAIIKKDFESNIFNESQVTSTQILRDLENSCPNVIKNVNEYIIQKGGVNFSNEFMFNNFLLYTFSNICENANVIEIYEKYNLNYDKNIQQTINSYVDLKNKIEPLSNELKLNSINKIKLEFEEIEDLFLKAEITEASYKIKYLNDEYENSILPLQNSINNYIETKKYFEEDNEFNLFKHSQDESMRLALSALNENDLNRAETELNNAKILHNKAKHNSIIVLIIGIFLFIIIGIIIYLLINKRKSDRIKSKKHYHSKKLKE